MVVDRAKIEQLEKELEEARRQLWKEDAKRYQVLAREISGDEQRRIMEGLTDRNERILFGLEEEQAPQKRAASAGGGGEETCPICGRSGLTKRGLGLHMI